MHPASVVHKKASDKLSCSSPNSQRLSCGKQLFAGMHGVPITGNQSSCAQASVQLCNAGLEAFDVGLEVAVPSALLTAAIRALHWLAPFLPDEDHMVSRFLTLFPCMIQAVADSLPDQLLVCASLGALEVRAQHHKDANKLAGRIMQKVKQDDMRGIIFSKFEDVMQVHFYLPHAQNHSMTLYTMQSYQQ